MESPFGKITSPEKFIEFYWQEMKDYLNARNIQINKSGFAGFMLNMLGFLQYDIKQYYDRLYRESFPASASDPKSLYFHSVIYGYVPPMADYASLTGEIEFNLAILPAVTADVISRDIYFTDLSLNINGIEFNQFSEYRITTTDNRNYVAHISTHDGQVITTGFSSAFAKLPIIDFIQLTRYETTFRTPLYQFGTYYLYPITIKDNQVNSCEVYVDDIKFDVDPVRTLYTGDDNVVFIRYFYNKLLLEFGSGHHGKYVPNSEVKVILYLTKGTLGNIGKSSYVPSGTVMIIDNLYNGTSKTYNISASNFMTLRILYGSGGKDLLNPDELRTALVKYIRTRGNLVSEMDYRDIFSTVTEDSEIIFKKIDVRDNNIYNYIVLYDNYMVPMYTTTYSPIKSELVPDMEIDGKEAFIYPEFIDTDTNAQYISPFMFIRDANLRLYRGYIFYDLIDTYFGKTIRYLDNIQLPPMSFRCEYGNKNFNIYVKSYQDLSDYLFYVTSPQLNISQVRMNFVDPNNHKYTVPFFFNTVDFFIDVVHRGMKIARLEINNLSPVIDISDYLSVKEYIPDTVNLKQYINVNGNTVVTYREPDDHEIYLISFPVIERNQFLNNKKYILDKLVSIMTSLHYPGKRMLSDTISVMFFNTYIFDKLTHRIRQVYDKITMPLNLSVTVYFDKSKLDKYYNFDFKSDVERLTIELANILKTVYTGKSISFYRTKIIDYLHNRDWVKRCTIEVTDATGAIVNDIETNDNMMVMRQLNKFEGSTFVPYYWWWDLNNIKVNFVAE